MLVKLLRRGNGKTQNETYQHEKEHLIELHQVVKNFDTAAGTFTALKTVDLKVNQGEFV